MKVLPDDKMREIGFTDFVKTRWYYCVMLDKNVSFNLSIEKKNPLCFRIEVLDENFLQPYNYEYILDSRGEALYFKRIKSREERKTEIYDTAFQGEGMEFIPVPYRQGDILYIDCRPFLDPTYCLIYYVGDDRECCSVRCLYPQCGDVIGEGALKHGHFYSSILSDSSANYISPLFRAELYNGILPKEYQFMEEIRIQLFRNEGLSGEMDKFFFNNIRSFYVKQSYRILGDDTCADHARIDGICKKDLMALCVKRC